jgi:magnesium-transporting ATPase (P-type)
MARSSKSDASVLLNQRACIDLDQIAACAKQSSFILLQLRIEAALRRKRYGPNALAVKKKQGALGLFVNQFKSPLAVILIVASVVSLIATEAVMHCDALKQLITAIKQLLFRAPCGGGRSAPT